MSSPTPSTSATSEGLVGPVAGDRTPEQSFVNGLSSVVIALGSNLGNRRLNLLRAVAELRSQLTIVRISAIHESEAVDSPPDSPPFLNMVLAGFTRKTPENLLSDMQSIERRLGRRRGIRNAPRTIDLDLLLHSANLRRSDALVLPHPRYRQREFVMTPLWELDLRWVDPQTGEPIFARAARPVSGSLSSRHHRLNGGEPG